MKKTVTISYPASPQRVAAMLADPQYLRQRLSRVGLKEAEVDVVPHGDGFVSTVSGDVPASRLPQAAKRFIGSAVGFTLNESWDAPGDDGSRSGTLEATVSGAPVRVGATSRLAPASGNPEQATTLTMEMELRVSVPLIGRTLEDKAMSMVGLVVADEEKRAAAWLTQH